MEEKPPPKDQSPDEDVDLNEDDIVEVIEITDGDGLEEDVEDMGLNQNSEGYLDDGEEEDEIEMKDDFEIEDESKITFQKHKGSVFCIALNPADPKMAGSGAEDDKAYLWNTDNCDVIKEISGHKDSVTFVEFSNNGKYFATADMSGCVQVWTVADGSLKWGFEFSDIEWMSWHPVAIVLFIGTVDGDIYMAVPSGDCKILSGGGQKTTAGCVLPNGKQLFAGYENGTLILWDLKTTTQMFSLKDEFGHKDNVNCVSSSANSSLLVSGSYDCTIKVISAANGKVLCSFEAGFPQSGEESENSSVECVAFSSDTQYVLSGSLSGVLGIWDISAQRLRHSCKHPLGAGITRLSIDPTVSFHIFTGALDGVVRLWDIRSGECLRQWCGHAEAVLDLKISKDGRTLLSSSDDGTAKIFEV